MLRVTIDVNGKIIGEMKIVRDLTDNDQVRNYTVKLRGDDFPKCRVLGFDSKLGPWHLVAEAIKATHPLET